jgi:hypothetical protein
MRHECKGCGAQLDTDAIELRPDVEVRHEGHRTWELTSPDGDTIRIAAGQGVDETHIRPAAP